jgi:hypothetical protein
MSNDNELKPPEGWISEGVNSSTEIRDPSGSTGPDAENSDWIYESKPKQRNPASDALTGAAIGVGSKVVNPVTEKVLGTVANKLVGPEIAGAKSSIYHPQPSTPVAKWTRAMHTGDISAAKDARHFGEANRKMMEFYEAEKKLEALRKAEALFQTEEQIRKSATPVANTIRTASQVMSPTGESLLGKVAGLGAQTLGRAVAGGSAAYQGVDAYNRWQRGDYPGAVMSGVGALGSGVAMIPTPVTRVVGTGLGIGGELGTTLLDKYREHNPPQQEMAQGGSVQHFQVGGKALSSGLEALQGLIKAEGRTPIVPMPNRWFTKPEDFPHLQGMVGKVLDKNQMSRDAFHSGAFVDPRTGQILDSNIYNNVGVLVDPFTGKPMMSAGDLSGIESLKDLGNKAGNQTMSNLVRQGLFKHTGGDQMLSNTPFIATIEQGGMGHKYGLGTEYANPTQLYNTMRGDNPTLRPKSRGDVFGMGDVVGQVQVGGPKGLTHDVYEKLFVAPKGSDVPGVKLSKAEGGEVKKLDANESGAFVGYPQINKNRKIGSGTGFLDALVGAPPSRENVLDPSHANYMQGYEKGEPYGIAGMALPFAGLAKNAIRQTMPPKLLDVSKHQFLHGTSPEAKAAILESGKFDPHPARWPSYSYSEIGSDTTFASPKGGWWLDQNKAASGRAAQYKSAVGVDIDPSAKIAHIRNADDWNHFAKKMGFKNGDDLYNKLQAEDLDAYNYAKNLTPQQYDQLQMERIQKSQDTFRGEKPGDFHHMPPEYWKEQIERIPGDYQSALNSPAVLGPRAAVQKIRDKGYHGVYVDRHNTQDYRVKIPADEQLAIFDQSVIKPNPDIGYAGGGRVGALTELFNLIKQRGGSAAATRLERAADLIPNLEHQFQPQALERAFTGDNASAVMVMPPKNFEKYAAPIDTGYKSSVMETYGIGDPEKYGGYNNMPKGTYQNYIDYLGQFTRPGGGGLSDVPYLQLGQELNSSFPAVLGHEGRHRTAALEKLGDQSTLVRMMPRAALREPFPRRSQEEYLNALVEKIGQKPFVKPQVYRDDAGKDVRRGLIELPDMFKKGGKV